MCPTDDQSTLGQYLKPGTTPGGGSLLHSAWEHSRHTSWQKLQPFPVSPNASSRSAQSGLWVQILRALPDNIRLASADSSLSGPYPGHTASPGGKHRTLPFRRSHSVRNPARSACRDREYVTALPTDSSGTRPNPSPRKCLSADSSGLHRMPPRRPLPPAPPARSRNRTRTASVTTPASMPELPPAPEDSSRRSLKHAWRSPHQAL